VRHLAGVVFAVAAFIIVLLCMPATGAIYTHDTLSYEYAASTLLDSGRLLYFGYDTPIIQWPPFYIIILSILELTGVTIAQGIGWLNAVLFAYLVYASSLYLFETLKVKLLAIPALILLVMSVPLIHISGYGWSEMLFIFLSVLSMVLMLMYIKKKSISWLISCAIISGLCWLTRYIGIVIIASLCITLFIFEKPAIEKFKRTFSYGVFSCFPMALWVIRNLVISGTLTGGRQPGTYTISDNIELTLSVLNEWFSFLTPVFTYIALAFLLFLVVLAIPLKRTKRKKTSDLAPNLLTNFLIIATYSAALLISATNTAMDPINTRLWSPVYPFLVFTVIFAWDLLLRNIKEDKIKGGIAAGFIVVALTMAVNPLLWLQSEGITRKDALLGTKQSAYVKNSPVLSLTRETVAQSEGTLIISNDASIIAAHTDIKCYYPPKSEGISLYTYDKYSERVADFEKIYLVWSGPLDSESFMDVAAFDEVYDMEKVAQNNYCSIYLLK
jgi:hypothetical protein